jgi:hypothetical protein
MGDITFHIRAWAGWTSEMPEPELQTPQVLRRRITPVGRTALGLAWAQTSSAQARYIFSSRHGEFSRTLSLLQAAVAGEELSPADFTLSVHHALIGLLSIAQQNKNGHSAIAAGEDSFCFALIEAAACLAENPAQPVLLIHCDDLLPAPYDTFAEPGDQPIALALMLTADGKDTITVTQSWQDQSSDRTENQAALFSKFLSANAAAGQSQGHSRRWKWTRHAGA